MPSRNTVIRSLHDLGAAAWFGGSLMGAVGLNGAADAVRDPQDRARVASLGWAKWAPVNAAAIGAHLVGGGALLYANRDRAQHQGGVKANTITKIVVTGAALAATAIQRCPRSQDRHSRRRIRRGCYRTGALDPRRGHRRSAATAVCAVGSAGSDRGHRRSGSAAGRAATPRTNSHRARFHSGPSCPQVNPHCFPNRHD